MKKLNLVEYDVKPTNPIPNTVGVVDGNIYYYNNNGIEITVGGDFDDISINWDNVENKPETYPPTIGTTVTTAAAGNHTHSEYASTSHKHTTANITDLSDVGKSVITASTATAARTAIGAGTGNSNLVLGTSPTTAKAGNYTPSATEIVTAIEAMTPEQVTAVQAKLGIIVST